MSDLFFVLKMTIMTFIIVIIMQVKFGASTVEQQTMNWVRTSNVVAPLHEVAQGAMVFLRQGFRQLTGSVSSKAGSLLDSENVPGKRHLRFQMDRSEAFLREQAERLKQQVQDQEASSSQ